jgi:hypothetical protein
MRKGFLLSALLMPLLVAGTVRAGDKDQCGDDLKCDDCPSSNWYVGFDLAILKPHVGSLGVNLTGTDVALTPEYDYEFAPRFWLGWDNPDGLGIRARYFNFDADATQELPGPLAIGDVLLEGLNTQLSAQTFDLEATQRGCLGNLQFQLGGGFRYAKMETGLGVEGLADVDGEIVPFIGGIGMDFEGVGPTVAIDVRRPFGCRGLALVGGARSSWMYGTTDFHGTGIIADLPISVYAEDHMMQISELSLGVEWSRCLARGGKVSVAALWEAQAWEWAPVASLIHQDIGLTGPTFSFSYMR